jgi:rod shape determining protein RodA
MAVVIPSGSVFIWMLLQGKIPETIIKPYQRNRILSFIYPQEYADQWYQQEYSIIAIGSGALTGKGIGNDTYASVKTGNFLSEAQTDFILTIIGEEMGFIGCTLVVVLLTLIVVECFLTARRAIDLEGKLIAGGVGALIAFQTLVNVAVSTGMMCNTGIPLPFVSAGLSSLISMCCGIGLVLNVGMVRHEAVRTTHFVEKISPGVGDVTKEEKA